MSQPIWKFVANLGDAHPLDYGGYFVYVDETGVYPPEAEYLEVDESALDRLDNAEMRRGEDEPMPEDKTTPYTVYRFILEPCTFINGILSDNPFHPAYPAWFDLTAIASSVDETVERLAELFTSAEPLERAQAWRMVGQYYGWDNLDSYPLHLTRTEAKERYKEMNR